VICNDLRNVVPLRWRLSGHTGRMADYRSLQAWKSARAVTGFALRILRLSGKTAPAAFLDQLCRAALSVQLNIAEGYALGTRPQFRRHLAIAFGSAIEVDEVLTTLLEERWRNAGAPSELCWDSSRSSALSSRSGFYSFQPSFCQVFPWFSPSLPLVFPQSSPGFPPVFPYFTTTATSTFLGTPNSGGASGGPKRRIRVPGALGVNSKS